jgi:signal transduction histidine kinase
MGLSDVNVALVEDNPGDARLIREMLIEASGTELWRIRHVERLADLADVLEGNAYSVILLDLSLPDSHGISTFRAVRDIAPEIPIVVLSGLDDEYLARNAVAEGAQDYLMKGEVTSGLLGRSIHYAIERNQIVQELATAYTREQHLVRQLQELDEVKNRFVATTSHELRTPLTSITGFSSTLREQWDALGDDDKQQFIDIIYEQGDRLSRIVEQLLTLSRITSGAIDPRPTRVELNIAINSAVRSQRTDGIHVSCENGVAVHADSDYFQQILVNLLANASHYGEPPIFVEVREHGDVVEVCVIDCGDGVPDDFVDQLFTEFARASHDHAGTGLGLSIARGLARAQNGDVWYEPNEPSGARFCIQLPRAVGERHERRELATA